MNMQKAVLILFTHRWPQCGPRLALGGRTQQPVWCWTPAPALSVTSRLGRCESGSFAETHRAVAYIRESRYPCHLFGTTRRRRAAFKHIIRVRNLGVIAAPQYCSTGRSVTRIHILRRRARSASFAPVVYIEALPLEVHFRRQSSPWARAPSSERTSIEEPHVSRVTKTRAKRSRICFGSWAACAGCTTSTWAGICRVCCGGAPSADTLASVGSGTCSTLASTWPTQTTTRNTWRKSITWFAFTKRLVKLMKIIYVRMVIYTLHSQKQTVMILKFRQRKTKLTENILEYKR